MMSKQMNSNQRSNTKHSNQNRKPKPFCKVCFDAKKPKEIYESHWVRDREGKVTCTTLNEQECRYCYEKGHTVKFCKALERNNKEKERAAKNEAEKSRKEKEQKEQEKKAKSQKSQKQGAFAVFNEDSDDDDEKESKPIVEEWPQLCCGEYKDKKGLIESRPVKSISFADAAKKTKEEHIKEVIIQAEQTKEQRWTQLSKTSDGKTKIIEQKKEEEIASNKSKSLLPAPPSFVTQRKKWTSWADAVSDSDSEDEDEYEYEALNLNKKVVDVEVDPTW